MRKIGIEKAGGAQELRLTLFRRDAADHPDANIRSIAGCIEAGTVVLPHAVVDHPNPALARLAGIRRERSAYETAGCDDCGARQTEGPSCQAQRISIEKA